jgi:7,8-dihydropterin-6-yl-methyl-4-(beta-D-ribofuranosyl)aminobenzene 5'-phosphate synthase
MDWKDGTVEALTLTVLMDDRGGMNSPYLAQHGVAFLIELTVKEETHRILFDTGAYCDPVLSNMRTAGIDPTCVEMIIISHSHYDHTGGLEGLVRAIGRPDLPIIAHPEIFRTSFITEPFFHHVGIPGPDLRRRVESLGGRWLLAHEPLMLATGVLYSGTVPRNNNLESPAGMRLFHEQAGGVVPDPILDDVSLYIHTSKGLVVITGCAHAGIVNIIEYGKQLTGKSAVYGVVGGFHLTGADDQRIDWTIEQLAAGVSGPIYSGHCTGLKAEGRLLERLGEKYRSFHSGKSIRFVFE